MKLLILIASLAFVSARFAKEGVVQNKLHVPADQSVSSFKEEFLPKRGGRIANGASAVDGQFPFAVRLVGMLTATTGFQCSGSLISATYVLSARHCIADLNPYIIEAMLGAANTQSPKRTTIYCNSWSYMNSVPGFHPDIALFGLSQAVAFNSFIAPIRLPKASQVSTTYVGLPVVNVGYGGGRTVLQYGSFKIKPNAECSLRPNLLCSVGDPNRSTSLEHGDSGGSMIIYENGSPVLVGVNVAIASYPDGSTKMLSTRVASYFKFIKIVAGITIAP